MRKTFVTIALLASIDLAAQNPAANSTSAEALGSLRWRSIGPANMGGRVNDIVGVRDNPAIFYIGVAGGGVFKTSNAGTTFEAIFDNQAVLDIGALAIAPSDPNVVWVGTGEGNPRNSASVGDGVYRSTDAGKTWTHMGLRDTERIARIRVHPRDANTVYVAALGREWGPNEERGLFKTTDGGKTWRKILYKNDSTGASDIDLDQSNPETIYAGMYTFRRQPWFFTSGGGETALYRSTDGGETWTKLSNGLPKGPLDRVGVSVAQSRPATVYMVTEAKDEGVLFRSDDRGDTWEVVNRDPNINFRPFYYSDIRVDPNDHQRVYSLSGPLFVSTDGGRTFGRIGAGTHGDHQALWIDPSNSDRILSGSDGGYQVSYDRGRTFDVINNVPISQFYNITVDQRDPYYICGGLQDNANWCGPVATGYSEGIQKGDWYGMPSHDGIHAIADPRAPHVVYANTQGGAITVTDTSTGSVRSIHPHPVEVASAGNWIANHKYRFSWEPAMMISPHDPRVLYTGGNVLFRTRDGGHTWDVISPDLTTNDKAKQQTSGGPVVQDNTGAEFHCTIIALSESPLRAGVIWAGTDDGNVQVTTDGGESWTNVTPHVTGLPPNSWISHVEASRFDAGTAYVTADRHRTNDFQPYIFKTTDFGKTWSAIGSALPERNFVYVVREDPKNRSLLYAGTHFGVFASWDGGATWSSIRNGLPPVAVYDLLVHARDNDLVIATHGRGLYVLDDITPLQQLQAARSTSLTLFPPRQATRKLLWRRDGSLGQRTFVAPNPPNGAVISYYVASAPTGPVTASITNNEGELIRKLTLSSVRPGVNRFVWDLRYDGARAAESDNGQPMPSFGHNPAGYRNGDGPLVLPGDYSVAIDVAGNTAKVPLKVRMDPRVRVTDADLQSTKDALLHLRRLTTDTNLVVDGTESLLEQLTKALDAAKAAASGADLNAARTSRALIELLETTRTRTRELRGKLTRLTPGIMFREGPKLREEILANAADLNGSAAPPNAPQDVRLKELAADAARLVAEFNQLATDIIGRVNERLRGQSRIEVSPIVP